MIELERDKIGIGTECYSFKHNNTLYELVRYNDQSLFWLRKMDARNILFHCSYNKKFGWVRTAKYRIADTFLAQVSIEEAKLLIELDIL